MRAIIRFSVNGEKTGALRTKLFKLLTAKHFSLQPNTATYVTKTRRGISEDDLGYILQAFWNKAHLHRGTGKLDHFWMYTDR